MAVYFLRSKHISRSNGSRVTRAAAYRAGELIRNEATSELFDYSNPRQPAPQREGVESSSRRSGRREQDLER
jgi:hypothetical protein